MHSGSACPSAGEPVHRAVREWPQVPGVDRPIGHAAGTSSAVAHDGWLRGALVLVTISRPASGRLATPCPVLSQAPPPNPIAAEPDGGRVLSRGGV